MTAVIEREPVASTLSPPERTVLHLPQGVVTEEQFFDICQANPLIRMERRSNGDIVIMPPSGSETGAISFGIAGQLYVWNTRSKTGKAFDSSTGFTLPNRAIISPDASWITLPRWRALTKAQRVRFAPISPDFVVELMSPSDRRLETQAKMREYRDNGVRLGWLIDSQKKQVEVYEPGKETILLHEPPTIAGDPVLAGFTLDLTEIWTED